MGLGDGRVGLFSLDPSFLFESKTCPLLHSLKLKQKPDHLSWKPLRERFSILTYVSRRAGGMLPGQGLYSQVRDTGGLHLGEGGPVGAEGGRAVDQRTVLGQALGGRDRV